MYDPDTLPVGVLGKPHGLAGEMVLRPYNAAGAWQALQGGNPDSLMLERDGRVTTMRVRSCRNAGTRLLVAFEGVTTPEAARTLTLSIVRVPRAALPPLGPGEYYVEDVVGCEVINADGASLGTVDETFWNGAHDIMIVNAGADECLIPLVPDYVRSVDAAGRKVMVAWERQDV